MKFSKKPIYVTLRGIKYNLTQAKEFIGSILNYYNEGDKVSEEHKLLLLDVVSYHPRKQEKIGVGVQDFVVGLDPLRGEKRFDIVRIDGTLCDFSFYKCFKTYKPETEILAAFRYSVEDITKNFKLSKFQNNTSIICPLTWQRIDYMSARTSYEPPQSLNKLILDFLVSHGLYLFSIETYEIEGGGAKLIKDLSIENNWRTFFKNQAKLKIVSINAKYETKHLNIDWGNNVIIK